MDLYLRWQHLWSLVGPQSHRDRLFGEIQSRYTESHRAYHTLQHLAECLYHFDSVSHLVQHPVPVALAIWFHDSIYDTHRSDNEEASAQWAQLLLLEAGVSPAIVQRVADLIRLTKHDAEPVESDDALLLDIDLSILGADRVRFDEYEAQVRQEYQWVPWPTFCTVRAKILRSFLLRPAIYRTSAFQMRFEAQARANLEASAAHLSAN